MKIKKLYLFENGIEREDSFGETNLIYSEFNSKGKTTYFRLLLHSLGYSVPQTSRINFDKVSTRVQFETKKGEFIVSRIGNSLIVKSSNDRERPFLLPQEHILFLESIFDCDNIKILKNLLGIIYVDQEKGWTLLNRGSVVGRIKFNIEELIAGLSNSDVDELLSIKETNDKNIAKCNALVDILEYQTQLADKTNDFEMQKEIDKNSDKIKAIDFKIKTKKKELQNLKKAREEKKNAIDFIVGMKIKYFNGSEYVYIKEEDIKNSNEFEDEMEYRENVLKGDIYLLEKEKSILLEEYKTLIESNSTNIFGDSMSTESMIIEHNLKSIDINQIATMNLLTESKVSNKEVNKKLKSKLDPGKLEYGQEIDSLLKELAPLFGIEDEIINKKKIIFSRSFSDCSGAILQKIVFSFKLAFLKIVEKRLDEPLFFVLDSPRTRELDDANSKAIFDVLAKYRGSTQVFVGSIHKDYEGIELRRTILNKAIEPC